MTRTAAAPFWSRLIRRAQRLTAGWARAQSDGGDSRANLLPARLARLRAQTALVHLAVIAVCVGLLALRPAANGSQLGMWVVILLAFTGLRVMTAGIALADSSLVLEPIGVAVFLAGTGGPGSPFLSLALAGIWWASGIADSRTAPVYRIDRVSGHPNLQLAGVVEAPSARRVYLVYCLSLVCGYLVLSVPQAMRSGQAGAALQDAIAMIVIAVLVEGLRRVRRAATDAKMVVGLAAISDAALSSPVRQGLTRALRTNEVPVDYILAAGRAGLTFVQAELLPFLVLGLTNQEIADAIQVSEATVRYRLTRLYRALGVSGRKQAADRARELGLTPGTVDLRSI